MTNSAPCPACGQMLYDSTVVDPPDEIPCDGCGHERNLHCKSSMRAKKWHCDYGIDFDSDRRQRRKCNCTQLR